MRKIRNISIIIFVCVILLNQFFIASANESTSIIDAYEQLSSKYGSDSILISSLALPDI